MNRSIKMASSFGTLLFQANKAYNEVVEMKTLVTVVTIAILLIGLVLLGSSDTGISIADSGIPDNEVTSSVTRDSSATATITITMYAVADE